MRVYRIFTKYNIEEMLAGNSEALEQWGDKILFLTDPNEMDAIFDEDVGISISNIDGLLVGYQDSDGDYNMNNTYEQVSADSEKKPEFFTTKISIKMYPNMNSIILTSEPVKICMDIRPADGELLLRSLIRMVREQEENASNENGPNENGPNENARNRNIAHARSIGEKSKYNNSGNVNNSAPRKKKKFFRKSRKARKN